MLATVRSSEDGALGLAAPQVGASSRIFILRRPRFKNDDEYSTFMRRLQRGGGRGSRAGSVASTGSETATSEATAGSSYDSKRPNANTDYMVVINPVIMAKSEASELGIEGCLSVPDHPALVRRARRIEVEYYDEKGVKHEKEKWSGLPAVCFQHELDHLDGLLVVDRQQTTFLRGRSEDEEMSIAGERFQLEFFKHYEGPKGEGKVVSLR